MTISGRSSMSHDHLRCVRVTRECLQVSSGHRPASGIVTAIEHDCFLTNLHLAVCQAANPIVNVQNRTRRVLTGLDQAEAARNRTVTEQSLAGTEHDRELPEAQGVDEVVLEKSLEEST